MSRSLQKRWQRWTTAFQLYSLVPYSLAFAFMVAVTLLGCFLSFRQDEASLSVISALGGLGTPFLLYDDAGSLGGLVLYTCLILAGTGAVYFYKGWASLLCVSFAGGWLVLLIGYLSGFSFWAASSFEDRWILQLGVTFIWLLFWLVPVAREVLRGSGGVMARLYTVTTPIVALGFTAAIWRFTSSEFGWITLSGAALALERFGDSRGLSRFHVLVALLLLTHTLFLMLEGDVLFFTLAAEATILHLVARRFSDRIVSAGAHLLSSIAALWLANRLLPGILENFLNPAYPALFNARALVDLAVIALTFGASVLVLPRNLSLAYPEPRVPCRCTRRTPRPALARTLGAAGWRRLGHRGLRPLRRRASRRRAPARPRLARQGWHGYAIPRGHQALSRGPGGGRGTLAHASLPRLRRPLPRPEILPPLPLATGLRRRPRSWLLLGGRPLMRGSGEVQPGDSKRQNVAVLGLWMSVIHNMLWIKAREWGISGIGVTRP